MRRFLGLALAILCVAGTAPKAVAQSIQAFGVGKKRDFLQTSTAMPTSGAILGDPNGPYHFSADVSGTSLNLLNPAPKVTTPNAAQYVLAGDSIDRGIAGNYTTKAALDAAFPNGAYSFTAGGYTLPISLGTTDGYPADIPRVANGTWDAQGRLVTGAWIDTTLNFAGFSDFYSGGVGGMITFNVYALSGNTLGDELVSWESTHLAGYVTGPLLTTYTIPSGTLQPGKTYYAEVSFGRIATLNTSFAESLGAVGTSYFVNTTGFIISTHTLATFLSGPGNQTKTDGEYLYYSCLPHDEYSVPTLQWQRLPAGTTTWIDLANGGSFSGTTTANLKIDPVTYAMNGDQFRLVATNEAGSVASPSGTLTVIPPTAPSIYQQPASLNINEGLIANFNLIAYGTDPRTYQWYRNGQAIPGATSLGLTIPDVQPSHAGSYTVVISNSGGSITSNPAVLTVNPAVGVISVAAGSYTSFYLQADGTLMGMGYNEYYQLGDGAQLDWNVPRKIASNVISVSGANRHTMFVKADGSLWAMGSNEYGQLGDGTKASRYVPTQVATGVVAVAAGMMHSLFIKSDGSLWGTGGNWHGQLGDGTAQDSPVPVQIATEVVAAYAGSSHSLFLKSDGTLWAMGNNEFGQLGDGTTSKRYSPVQIASGVAWAAAGGSQSFFGKTDGSLWSTGYNYWSQLGDGTTTTQLSPAQVATQVVAAAAGGAHSLWMKSDGTLWGVGYNYSGQLGDGTSVNRVTPVMTAHGLAAIAAGSGHSIFCKTDGSLWTMGEDFHGQRGDGNVNDYEYATGSPILLLKRIAYGSVPLPAAPTGLSVSPQQSANDIRVTWAPTVAATRYEVWRGTTNDPAAATKIAGDVPIPVFFDLTAVPGITYRYWVKAANPTGASGFSTSDAGMLEGPPVFATQPVSQIATVGAAITFSTVAGGVPIPTLQWQKNGADIVGATGGSYSIVGVAAGDVGNYTVVATNALGSTSSNVATLTLGTIPAGFDVQAYLARYPDVAALYSANPYAAWQHYHDVGIYQGEVFDELFRVDEYLALYPELFALFGSDLGAALDHWLSTGRIEGKLGRIPLEFSANGYFTRNPDVATAVNNNPILAWGHYWLYGIYEGRAYDDELRVFEYLAINADLTAAFVNDWRTAALHWMRYGRTEGRLGRLPLTFSVATYLSRNPDVAAVWGTDPTTVFLHFWLYGINEARTYDDLFRVDDYLALNPDLAAIFGSDRRGAFKHWVRYGQAEGRTGKL